ncbi:MAG: NAD(P)-binding domain-containing protein, partial [Acidimicrobiales bacterium]
MQVAIIGGTGPLGRGLALRLADAGHHVVVGSRDAARAGDIVAEHLGAWPGRDRPVTGTANE